jgi:hypothetical protein
MADNLLEPLLIVNTQARVAGQPSPAMSQSITAAYAAGQTLNQTLVLQPGQSYAPGIGFSNLVINTTGPVQLLAASGSNASFINQVVNQQTTIDAAADSFTVTNNGTTAVTVKMLVLVAPNNSTTPSGVVTSLDGMIGNINLAAGPGISITNNAQTITITNTGATSVNGQTGNVTINASNLPGLATVATTGLYSSLIGAPGPYTLPVATASILGGIKVGAGLSITQDGTLSVSGAGQNLVTSVNTLQGAVTIEATDNGAANSQSLIVNSGATTGDIILNRLAVAGSGLAISTANGVTTITSSGIQGAVQTVDSQAPDVHGNVIVQAIDNPVGTGGTSLITNSGSTTGNLTFKKLVAGNNIGLSADANGNILVTGTVNAYTLPPATTTTLGGVKQGTGVSIAADGTISIASSYILPIATASILGGVKIGSNVNVAADGTISVAAPYVLPIASATSLGGIKIGANLNLDADGTLWANPPFTLVPATPTILGGVKIGANINYLPDGTISVAPPYQLPIASTTTLGGIKIGNNLTIDANGYLSAVTGSYTLPAATTTTLGGVIVGANLTVNSSGVLSAGAPYVLPPATASVLGGVKAGSGVSIASDGTLSATYTLPIATFSVLGGVKIGANVNVAGDGTISVAAPYTLPIASATVLGGVKIGANLSIDVNGVLSASTNTYTLPVATASVLGGVKQGANVTIAGDGTISVAGPYTLPVATNSVLGGIIVGSNLTITESGVLSATASPYTLPVASASVLGGVMIGSGLSINAGVLSVSAAAPVTSVSGQTGAVVIQAQSASPESGSQSLIVNSGASTGTITTRDLLAGTNVTITPDASGNLVIASSGGVTSVSEQTGVVTVQAVDNNTSTGLSLISNSGATTGTIKLLRLVAGNNVTLGPDTAGNIEISTPTPSAPYVLPAATASTLGGVKIGANVTVAEDGTISVATPYTLPIAAASVLGGIKVGSGLSIAGDGTLSTSGGVTSVNGIQGAVTVSTTDENTASGVTLIADSGIGTAQAKLWRLVAGSGITLSNDVNGNVEITATGTGGVSSVSGQTGAVIVEVTDANTATGTSLIANNGSTTANPTLLRLVAGSNIAFSNDASGNLVIASSAASGVTSVSGQTGTVVVQATDVSTASGTTLIGNSGATTADITIKRIVAGTNISVSNDANGNLLVGNTYALPIATASVLGGVKAGSGVTIAGDGTISVAAAAVTSVSGQTGAVVIEATDNNTSSGTSLIANNGATTGNIKLLRIVAGNNVSLGTDANGNLTINSAQAQFYDVQAGASGTLTSNQILGQTPAVRTITLPANFAGSVGYAGVAATATAAISVSVWTSGTTTNVGTISFAAGSNTATFTTSGAVTVNPGSVIIFTAPATADATLGNVSITLLGTGA